MDPTRRFNILDAMIAIAVSSVALVVCAAFARVLWNLAPLNSGNGLPALGGGLDRLIDVGNVLRYAFIYSTIVLLAWSFGFLVIRLRNPRPPLRRLGRSPGVSACLTVLVIVAIRVLEALTTGAVWPPSFGFDEESILPVWGQLIRELGGIAGPSVVATWLVLVLNRRLRFQKDRLEIAGLLLAIGWILLLIEGGAIAIWYHLWLSASP